jgi:hypothetical protein
MAVEHGFMLRVAAVERTLATLRFFWNSQQGSEPNATGYKGFYYHFLDMRSGRRAWQSELSTVDSAFLLTGAGESGNPEGYWVSRWHYGINQGPIILMIEIIAHRGITSELYGGWPELRPKQKMALRIGGWRLLAALGIKPEVCHLNEGHAAFAVVERARSFMQETGRSCRQRRNRRAGVNWRHDLEQKWVRYASTK